ncbi:MAG: mucoidy inhibitor MuiA family protein [Shimia sp.]|nr:mucoidy inhibitor MuiA family protein [Shimia sp.]
MKHVIFATALFPLATPLLADDIRLNAPVTAATLYSEGATLTRTVPFSAPAGTHELLITNLPESLDPMSVRVALNGAKLGAVTVRHERVYPNQQADSPELTAAKAALDDAETALRTAEDNRTDILMKAEAAKARLAYLSTLQGPTDTAASPETITATLTLIGQETLAARQEIATAERQARVSIKILKDLQEAYSDARQLVDALTPSESDNAMLAISISADAATEGTLTLTHLTQRARWVPAYDVHLNNTDTPQLSIERGAFVSQYTDEDWTDVAVTLSTSRPDAQSDPSGLFPWRRHIEEKQQLMQKPASGRFAELDMSAAAPQMELAVVEDAAMYSFGDGINATYVYPTPVSVSSASDALHLALGTLDLTPETYAFANPMRDETAFLMAEATNDSGELILPSFEANFFLNGTYIGQQEMPLIAEGDDIDFSFGPINGLRLSDKVTNKITGDKGVLTSRNEQSETRVLTAENLTGRTWELRLLGRVPYSEQEDLVITHQATLTPTETNYEDQRGILMWGHSLTAGERFEIELSHKIQWPSEMILR